MATDFSSKYVNANLARDAAPYNKDLFSRLISELANKLSLYTPGLSYGILVAMLCAQQRGDAAGLLFECGLEDQGESHLNELFSVVRESVTLATGFVGLPNTMPANFGLIAQLKKRNIQEVPQKSRPGFDSTDYSVIGKETHKAIYRGVGNPEVSEMLAQYMPDLSYLANNAFFGYTIGGCHTMSLKEREIIVVSSIIALGASRQARSHCKAAMQLGNSADLLETIDSVAQELATWNGRALPEKLDVPQLVKDLQAELAKVE